MRATILCLVFCLSAPAIAQTPPTQSRAKKILTPDQIAYQQAVKIHDAEYDELRAAAISAFNAEAAREKAPTCPDASNTYDISTCISHENDLTNANLKAFAAAIRAMLALPYAQFPGQPDTPAEGPSGQEATPATSTAAFDKAQSAWQAYSEAQRSFVDTLWRGGTIVNSMVGYCGLRLSRARMHELNDVYDMQLRH
jgi:uncharacterized protein YecT (DUF1311 family)